MAASFLNYYGSDRFIASSAGIEPGTLNPLVVKSMQEIGIDISRNTTQSVDDVISRKESFDFVVTVCDETSAERCPVFPGSGKRLHWGFPDPSQFKGTEREKLDKIALVRDEIKNTVSNFLKQQVN